MIPKKNKELNLTFETLKKSKKNGYSIQPHNNKKRKQNLK